MAESQQTVYDSSRLIRKELTFTQTREDVPSPPLHLKTKFKTINDWLSSICRLSKPAKYISDFQFGLFESTNDYTLFLVGQNTYDTGKSHSEIRNEFQPRDMYNKLRKSEFQNLTRDQLLNKLTSQLKDFSKTDEFKNSFFTKSDKVVFETNGELIWVNQELKAD